MPTRSPIIHEDDHLTDSNVQNFSHMRLDSILHASDPCIIKTIQQEPSKPQLATASSNASTASGSVHVTIKRSQTLQNKRHHSNPEIKQHTPKPAIPPLAQASRSLPNPVTPPLLPTHDTQDYNRPTEFDFDTVTDTLDFPSQRDYREDGDEKTRYELMPFVRDRIYTQPRSSKYTLSLTVLSATILVLLTSTLLGFDPMATSRSLIEGNKDTAQAQQALPDPAYKKWANAIDFGSNVNAETKNADPDIDDLTNYEEYLLQSNPLQAKSCENIESDSLGLLDLINPGTCREVDWDNSKEVQKFVSVFVSKKEYITFINRYNPAITTASVLTQNITPSSNLSPTVSVEKIKNYIQKQNPQSTLDPQLILDLSNKHSLNPELLLSLIQYGSNFGVNYDGTSNLTNIGTTSFGAYGFKTDEDGLKTTAQLIHYLNIRTIPDCAQMTIMYGGNLDSCAQVQSIYNQIRL